MTQALQQGQEMPKAYNPRDAEGRWYTFWEEKGYFTPQIDGSKRPFVIIMPPPNVTGELHLGHALTATLEDIMIRWHRMRGDPSLWLPGRDHASIAAQNVVEHALAGEGISRRDLGREKFLERMWQWMEKYSRIIIDQHRRLGASCDWTRERFTMDPGPSRAVASTFVNLHNKGLIYRGQRIINWCPRCSTALSDLEVEHETVDSHLWYVRYPLADGDGYITVATTRPETIMGDTAVAVNPDDSRYQRLLGKEVTLPIIGRRIPIIGDEVVDPSFGAGALKITPAHDPVDFEVSQRHNLPPVITMNLDGTMNQEAGPYNGMERFECRDAVVEHLKREGLLDKIEPYSHAIGHCYRCGTVVEPMISRQWFVSIAPLASRAIQAVADGRITIIPERFAKVYYNWMENIRDWCISRQLWWGHRIPAWYCGACDGDKIEVTFLEPQHPPEADGGSAVEGGTFAQLRAQGFNAQQIVDNANLLLIGDSANPIVQIIPPERCPSCGGVDLIQDPDVLDTWFSSALWPHSTLGWPDNTDDMRYFYPPNANAVMETGYDILFFWVARMIMMGLENTGDVPFQTVYLHGLIRDEKGEKMSKSKGNVVNPIEALEQYGTDALRYTLATGGTPGNDMKLSPQRMEASRNFANKLWNAARFVISNLSGPIEGINFDGNGPEGVHQDSPGEDVWILRKLARLTSETNKLLEDYQFGEAGRRVHDFLWGDYCDWYIEMAKIRLRSGREAELARCVLVYVLERSLRLLHPFMPFITEEIWQSLKPFIAQGSTFPEALIIAPYPEPAPRWLVESPLKEDDTEFVIDVIRAIRNARAEHGVEAARYIDATVYSDDDVHRILREQEAVVKTLARLRTLELRDDEQNRPLNAVPVVLTRCEVYLPLAAMVDMDAERGRLSRDLDRESAEFHRLEAKLANPDFVTRAPDVVVSKERSRLEEARGRVERLRERLATIA